ncbi:unnamed protein product [Gordionus sp. m RMFG-2023]
MHRHQYVIRLVLKGWTNRPFYHIAVAESGTTRESTYIEQIGSYDPLPNSNNEKLVAINFERLNYWMGQSTYCTSPVGILLGYAGYLPIYPLTKQKIYEKNKQLNSETIHSSL